MWYIPSRQVNTDEQMLGSVTSALFEIYLILPEWVYDSFRSKIIAIYEKNFPGTGRTFPSKDEVHAHFFPEESLGTDVSSL
jgi:hypothetical protein